MKLEKLEYLKSIIKESLALLETISEKSQLDLVPKEELQSVMNLYNELGYYNSSIPRVFLLGEFKAGKSSLVNAILKKDYAPIDIFEMTAWVTKFWKNESEYCKINFDDKTFENPTVSDFLSNCKERKYSTDYLSRIRTIEFGIKDYSKNYVLIDTPGFGSINERNEKKLIEVIYEADIILFIVDAESIGSMKEAAIIKESIKSGIPYFIVITKIDLVQDHNEIDEIKHFIQKEYQADAHKIFTVSTDKKYLNNGLSFLDDKLSEYANNFDSKKRQETEVGFLKIIVDRLLNLLDDLENILVDIKKKVDSFNSYIESVSGTIYKSLQIDIEDYAKTILLQNKREQIVLEIGEVLLNSEGNISEDQIITILNKNLGNDFLEFANKNISNAFVVKMKERWITYLDEIKDKSINVFAGIKGKVIDNDKDYYALPKVGNYDIQLDHITSKAFSRGMKGTLGFAGVLTAYAAWFAPTAAAITLPMALTGVGLPIAVVGTAISGLLAYKKRNQTKDMINSYAVEITDNLVVKIVQDIIMPKISENMKSLNSDFSVAIKNQFYNENMIGMDENINLDKVRNIKFQLWSEK
jgi:small GTP-binding protein